MKNSNNNIGLVLEGGGLRGMFTGGVLDIFLRKGITFDALAGVSSGALFGSNFKSQQPGRALRYNINYKDNKDYMSWKSWRDTGDYVNASFAYHMIPYYYDPFDFVTFKNNPMRFFSVCTDIEDGCPVYHEIINAEGDGLMWLQASASMPLAARPVEIGGRYYLDGGLVDSIPLQFLQEQGYTKNVVVLTQPRGYRKTKAHIQVALKMFLHKYPKVAQLMAQRHIMYNNQLEYIYSEEEKGNVFLIYPDDKLDIGRLELDENKMTHIYEAGERKALEVLPELKKFMEVDIE